MCHTTRELALNSASQEEVWRTLTFTRTSAFKRIESENGLVLDHHARYWCLRCGYTPAVLLNKASYSHEAQYRYLRFFQEITPFLGQEYRGEARQWKSYMTDDHIPVELS
ncbi:hypothetical protein HD806DRAFT_496244 [Xylariaceae sp. AK1471]|nr:hypothetical protein HD806DRAFT_496244 [Xylariaceae sp. AK1471]